MKKIQETVEGNNPDRLLTVLELADLLRIKPGTVHSWLSRGVDLPYIKVRSVTLFRESAVRAWLIAREVNTKRQRYEA